MESTSKNILILSPQSFDWPASKRHYAIAWARSGAKVYFVEPLQRKKFLCEIVPADKHEDLQIIRVTSPIPKRVRLLSHPFCVAL